MHEHRMSDIEGVYEDPRGRRFLSRSFEAVEEAKVEQMGGLADEETAAMLVAHEVGESEVGGIADIEPGMEEAKFLAKVLSIGEVRTFERDGEDEDGQVVNVEVADETGSVRAAFWDDHAQAAIEELEEGQVLRIKGRPKEGFSGVEISVDDVQPDDDTEIDVQVSDTYTVEDLSLGLSNVNLVGLLLDTDSVRTFDRDDGSEGKVSNLVLGDSTGRIRVTLWDEQADLATELEAGTTVEVIDGYVKDRDGQQNSTSATAVPSRKSTRTSSTSPRARRSRISRSIKWSISPASFARQTPSERSTATTARRDRSGTSASRTRPTTSASPSGATKPTSTSAQATRSHSATSRFRTAGRTISRPPRAGSRRSRSSSPIRPAPASRGRYERLERRERRPSAFAGDDGDPGESDARVSSSSSASSDATDDSASTDAGTDSEEPSDGEEREFTGVVVQAGDPIVLDDGETTMSSIATDADVGLGEEVTAEESSATVASTQTTCSDAASNLIGRLGKALRELASPIII